MCCAPLLGISLFFLFCLSKFSLSLNVCLKLLLPSSLLLFFGGRKKLVYLRACGSLKRCGTLITKTVLLSQCRQRFSEWGRGKQNKGNWQGLWLSVSVRVNTVCSASHLGAGQAFHQPSTAIPKDSFISPFQISVALTVSKIPTALIVCHLVLLFLSSHLLSAH